MKKSLLILSVLALAANVSAYDELVPGTASAPNYYYFQANRGVPYLAYSEEGYEFTVGSDEDAKTIKTNLYRTNSLSGQNIWAVYEGEDEGTVIIKSAGADAYLMSFSNYAGELTETADAVANVVDEPTDIYAVYRGEEGCYSFNLHNVQGWEYTDEAHTAYISYSLDASLVAGGTICGNYFPDDNGCKWWVTKLELQPGQTVDEAVCDIYRSSAETSLKKFIENVPFVAPQLQVGLETLAEVSADVDYVTEINELLTSAYAAANAELMTCFSGKTMALKSVRRAEMATPPADGPYMATDLVNGKYVAAVSYADPMTAFTIKSNGAGGYTFYNDATETYVGVVVTQVENQETHEMVDVENVSPVTDESKAQVFYPCLKGVDGLYGMALCRAEDYTGNGLNFQSWAGGAISFWSVNDPGSVWTLFEVNQESMRADVVEAVENALSPYLPNVYVIKDIFEKAIADVKALPYSADLLSKATSIQEKAFADANTLLATGLSGKPFALKYLRGNDFVAVGDVEGVQTYVHVPNALEPNAQFTFVEGFEGGYYVFNEATDTYFGPQQNEELDANGIMKDDLLIVSDSEEAQELYPVLYDFIDRADPANPVHYYGIALPFIAGAENTTPAINMNGGNGLHAYRIGDPGSIWGIFDPAETSIEEVGEAAPRVIEGIFDLSGRRLSAPVRGINIINGKKVLVK